MSARILVTGASIAGNAAAWWLGEHGCDVTVVERMPEFRTGGQNIDVRGMGREVLRAMGLEDAALARGTGEIGTAWVDAAGRTAAEFALDESDGDGPTAEMEILRGDLAELLYTPARERAAYRFGDSVAQIVQDDGGANVTFAGGGSDRYDAVIIAEGVGSATRDAVFGGENDPRWMDLTIAYFTIPRGDDDDRRWRWYNATEGRSVSLRPDSHGTARAMLSLQGPGAGEQDWDSDRQKAFLRERFADAGWETPRVLAGMERTDDFYFDVLRQVRMPRWSQGRIALTGDAAWCVTPLAGRGATLAIVGAYVLAGELSRHDDPAAAFSAYERYMRPIVERAANVPKIGPRLLHPRSRLGIHLLHGALKVASSDAVQGVSTKLFGGDRDEPPLPEYGRARDAGPPLR